MLKFVVAVSAVEVNDPLATFCDAFALLPKATFFTGFSLCNRRFSKIRLARLVRNIVVGSSFAGSTFLKFANFVSRNLDVKRKRKRKISSIKFALRRSSKLCVLACSTISTATRSWASKEEFCSRYASSSGLNVPIKSLSGTTHHHRHRLFRRGRAPW